MKGVASLGKGAKDARGAISALGPPSKMLVTTLLPVKIFGLNQNSKYGLARYGN